MTLQGIYDFATNVSIEKVEPIIKRQIEYNLSIAEGLNNSYGLSVGKNHAGGIGRFA